MRQILVSLLVLLLFDACSDQKEEVVERAEIFFEPVAASKSGVNFSNNLTYQENLNIIEYLYYYNGGGVAIGDINNDGLDDIYLSGNQVSDRLYVNLGNLKFEDITEKSGLQTDTSWSTGVTMADINNDGLLDIYVCKVGDYKGLKANNLLYINQGNNNFKESSAEYGLDFSGFSTQGSFFDYDNDGDLDFYLMNHSVHTPRSYGTIALRNERDSLAGDLFFENKLNEGSFRFEDVTEKSGIFSSALGYGLALATADINNDGYIDIYVGNDFHENDYLYINQGNKTFVESGSQYFAHTTRFTMGVDIADLNNDLQLDVFSLDMMPFDKEVFLKSAGEDSDKVAQIKANYGFEDQYARNVMQLNLGTGKFADVALMTNTYASDWSWSPLIQDFDNNGLNDIFVTNGIYKRPNDLNYINLLSSTNMSKYSQTQQNEVKKKLIEEMPTMNIPNVVYRNKGGFEFEMLTISAGMAPSYSNGAAYSDLDNDGDLDLVVNNINQKAQVLENKGMSTDSTAYVSFKLEGNENWPNTLGSKVYVYTDGREFFKELSVSKGFQSSSTHNLHFGLGTISKIDSVRIQWLDGSVQNLKNIGLNQHHTISKETNDLTKPRSDQQIAKGITNTFPYVHIENPYLDYERESLMPEKLSAEGPAMVVADFNGDSYNDIFLGGAKYQSPSYFIGQADGSFKSDKNSDFIKDAIYEDVDATALDIDNDGDLDLYVMSGGNEIAEGSDYVEDRVYINDGKGKFIRLPLELIKTNGGSVSSADFNGDGYDDLFIGSRSIPGGYGLSPYSFILENNGDGQFNVAVKQRMGMITDSQWADVNDDGLLDLVVVGDWMPISIYLNKGDAKFENATNTFGLENTNGMWNTVLVDDFNGDGTMDIVGGNTGLNFKWKASAERPVKLYLDDFDNNQQLDPIIFYDFFGNYVPFASKDKLVGQLPQLKKEFLDYEKFSKINSIEDLVGVKEETILETKKIIELRSMVYLQNEGQFEGQPLPEEAQISTIEDLYFDQDTRTLYFVGNYLDFVNELGKSAGNTGGSVKISKNGNLDFANFLVLPTGLNSRKIGEIKDDVLLVVSNNGKSYTLENFKN